MSITLGDVHREFMQRLSAVLHGTMGGDLRDVLQEGGALLLHASLLLYLRPRFI
jgi:uncharacterized membrane protein YeiH